MIGQKINKLFFPHDNKAEHFKALDGLRGIAVLFVLLSHSSNASIYFHELLNFQRIGKVGVYLFFVLSAYLLDRQIALAFISGKSSKLYWKNYALRRFLRIYPLFVLALILHGILSLVGLKTVIDNLLDIPLHMLLIKGESIFWSIPVEFKYYFISPFIMWFCHRFLNWNNIKIAFFFVVLIITTIGIELIFNLPRVSTWKYFPIFLVGTIISIYELNRVEIIKSIKPLYLNLMGFSSCLLILLTVPFYFKSIFGFEVDFHSSIFFFPYAVLWGIILLTAKYGKGLIKKILELKFLRFIGSISFSMYLFHMLFLRFVKVIGLHPQIQIYVFFILTILFSSVSYLLIERPLSKIRIYSNNVTEKEIKVKTTANKA
jgi:peptidoglycan/LPS O-acetylase OafA/YrhL